MGLHTHCIVFNATFDAVENRWKALQNHELLRARKFAENAYYHELTRELRGFGYLIRNRVRGDFEIEGVSEQLCERFSKRHTQIDEALAKLLAGKPELTGANFQALRAKLATAERSRKQKDLSHAELLTLWEAQLSEAERASLRQLSKLPGNHLNEKKSVTVSEAVQWAEEHLFDRNSVVRECQVWQEALGRARGEGFSVSELKEFTGKRGYIRDEERPGAVTLREVLLREWEIVQTAKEGVGDAWPLVANPRPANPKLDDEQRRALDALLSSINTVSVFRGGAGTGKSFVLNELVEQLQQSGRRVVVLAPQHQQVVEMERAGFPSPSTVANFILKRELAERAVVVVDEAGQIGGRQMLELMRLVRERNARLILSGDTRQHGAVDRVTVLRDGAVVGHFVRGEFAPEDIITAMVGRKLENLYPARESEVGTEEVLRVENLTVPHPHLANRNVVENINFTLRRGEILGLAGLVGSGRSEIVNALYGRLQHTGPVFVEGKAVRITSPRSAKAAGIGLLTEDRKREGLLFNFAIRENITVNHLPAIARLGLLRNAHEFKIATDCVQRLSIRAPSVLTLVGTLSGGNQQKVVLAKVLLPKPKILLLDEPTKGIDVGAKLEIYKLMMSLVQEGVGLVFISSELPELMALSDRILVLCAGKVRDHLTKSEISEHRIVRAAIGMG